MYQIYKPMRNYLMKHSISTSLADVWLHAKNNTWMNLQSAIHNTSSMILPWELELVAREIILHGKTYPTNNSFDVGKAVNFLREFTKNISKNYVHSYDDALAAIVPLAHQQMPWSDDMFSRIARYGQIYRHEPLADIFKTTLGISLSDWLKIGLSAFSIFEATPNVKRLIFSYLPGIDEKTVEKFFSMTATSIKDLKSNITSQIIYDKQWSYSFNPLRGRPIIYFQDNTNDLVFCPVPQLLIWRITDGIYYDLIGKKEHNFAQAFGDACEIYVGNVLKVSLQGKEIGVYGERPYHTSTGEKAGADWLLSDSSGHVFLECKAKRITQPAKMAGPGESMDKDLRVLAGYIVQNYKNIRDAMNGCVPGFDDAGLPVFSVIVTLENWWLFTPELKARLHALVEETLQENALPSSMTVDHPYTVLSFFELERTAQDIAKSGVATVLTPNSIYTKAAYKGCLFPETLAELMPDIAQEAGFNSFR